MAIVGVIPAAGHATRLQLLSGSKEMLTIGGKPVMDHLVERMRAGGCIRLRVVTRPEKKDVIAHAAELGADVVLGHPATVSESFLAGMAGLGEDDIVLIGLPDTLWEPIDGFRPLVDAVREGSEVAVGLFRIDAADLPRSDVVAFGVDGSIARIDIKPVEPASDWIWAAPPGRPMSGPGSTGPSGPEATSTYSAAKVETCAVSSSPRSGSTSGRRTRCSVPFPTTEREKPVVQGGFPIGPPRFELGTS